MAFVVQTSRGGGAAGPPAPEPGGFGGAFHRWWERNDLNVLLTAVLLVFLLTVLWPWIFVTIDSGHRGVYYSLFFGGTDVKHELREGFHLKLPWDKIFDYDVRIQQAVYKYSVISSDGLVVQFRTSIRYHPQVRYLGYLQREIGPDYVQTIVIPQTQTALRQVVGSTPIDQIYSTNVTFLQTAVVKAVGEVGLKYILIDDILITEIDIPEVIRKAIEAKLTQQQNSLQYDYVLSVAKKESERKRIEAEGVRDFQRIVTPGISQNFLRWRGIEATLDLAKSANSKVIVIGAQSGLPLILDTASALPGGPASPVPPQATPSSSPIPEPPVPKVMPSTDLRPPSLVPIPEVTPSVLAPDSVNHFP